MNADLLQLAKECGAVPVSFVAKPLEDSRDGVAMHPDSLTAFAARIRAEALEEAAKVAANLPACPFDGPCKLEPDDPCPVCGDLGHFDTTEPSNCKSAAHAIRALVLPSTGQKT